MLVSALYIVVCRLLELVVLLGRRERAKELEILVLRHELSVLRRQFGPPRFESHDRVLLAALSRHLPRRSWNLFLVQPETLLRWHRRLVARRWTYSHRPGRPPIGTEVRELIVRLARENSGWGYVRIVGELRKLGIGVSETSVRNILAQAGLPLAPAASRRTRIAATSRRPEPPRLGDSGGGLFEAPRLGGSDATLRAGVRKRQPTAPYRSGAKTHVGLANEATRRGTEFWHPPHGRRGSRVKTFVARRLFGALRGSIW